MLGRDYEDGYRTQWLNATIDADGYRIDENRQRLPDPGSENGRMRMSGSEEAAYDAEIEGERQWRLQNCSMAQF